MDTKKDLWLRLKRYQFESLVPVHLLDRVREAFGGADASTRAFADKLARKHGWSPRFAMGAIEEYRKFVYLGVVAPFAVTPSKVIDTVWHEHLLFTRGYREFCDSVLRREFDHHPELVPADDQTAEFQAQYEATRRWYRDEFDHEPPAAFWSIPKYVGRALPEEAREPKRRHDDDSGVWVYDSSPLHSSFSDGGGGHSLPEFGGGDSGGAGAGSDWGDAPADSSGDSGGGSDGGGSGCSSGCGGGGD